MREEEVKSVVNTVIEALKKKGMINEEREVKKFNMLGDNVGVGSAGKVFSKPLVNWNKNAQAAPAQTSFGGARTTSGLTGNEVSLIGASRLSVENPTQACPSLAGMIDHTLLKANATQEEVGKLCEEAKKYRFASVCVNPGYVAFAYSLLRGSGVMVCTVIGFPLGSTTAIAKALEARDAIANGADEIDMVMNVGAMKSGNVSAVYEDILEVRKATVGKTLKVILETAYLTREEKIIACELSKRAGADFVKTSTGFASGGATVEDIALMREVVGPAMGVKASGGIRDTETATAMVKAGASRVGASASVAIVTGQKTENKGY